nr:protein GFS12 isoform X1 [Tanacetum cinerariifolium]
MNDCEDEPVRSYTTSCLVVAYKAKLGYTYESRLVYAQNVLVVEKCLFMCLCAINAVALITGWQFQVDDSTPEELATVTQVQGPVFPILREKPTTELVKVTEEMKSFNAFPKIHLERTKKRHQARVGTGFKGSVQKWDLSRITSSSRYDGHEELPLKELLLVMEQVMFGIADQEKIYLFIDMDQGQKLHLWRSDPVETSFPSLISNICSCGSTKMQANKGTVSPSWIAVGLSSGHCRLLDMRSGNIITSWQAHEGYVTKVYQIPHGWQWAYWVSPLSYSFNTLPTNEFSAQRWMNKLATDKSSKLGVGILQNIGPTADRNWFWIGAAALLSLAIVFNVLFTLAIVYIDATTDENRRRSNLLRVVRHQQRKTSYPWIQFAFMGPKIYVSTTQGKKVDVAVNEEATESDEEPILPKKNLKDKMVVVHVDVHVDAYKLKAT